MKCELKEEKRHEVVITLTPEEASRIALFIQNLRTATPIAIVSLWQAITTSLKAIK